METSQRHRHEENKAGQCAGEWQGRLNRELCKVRSCGFQTGREEAELRKHFREHCRSHWPLELFMSLGEQIQRELPFCIAVTSKKKECREIL